MPAKRFIQKTKAKVKVENEVHFWSLEGGGKQKTGAPSWAECDRGRRSRNRSKFWRRPVGNGFITGFRRENHCAWAVKRGGQEQSFYKGEKKGSSKCREKEANDSLEKKKIIWVGRRGRKQAPNKGLSLSAR